MFFFELPKVYVKYYYYYYYSSSSSSYCHDDYFKYIPLLFVIGY